VLSRFQSEGELRSSQLLNTYAFSDFIKCALFLACLLWYGKPLDTQQVFHVQLCKVAAVREDVMNVTFEGVYIVTAKSLRVD